MATIVSTDLSARDAYRLLISAVVPRPIGWASTLGADGSVNLAPYSFFNSISGSPPMVMVSVGERKGQVKDTLRNARETGEMVINIVAADLAERMNLTSGDFAYGVSEFDQAGLTPAPCVDVRPPRVAEAGVALECKVTQIVPVDQSSHTLILGRVLRFHIRDGLLRPNGLIDPVALAPIARLGGDEYAHLGEVVEMERPTITP